jgi:hypothetical protein
MAMCEHHVGLYQPFASNLISNTHTTIYGFQLNLFSNRLRHMYNYEQYASWSSYQDDTDETPRFILVYDDNK